MKIIKSYMGKTSIEEAKLKERFFINGIEFATAKDLSKHYPFRAYHYASGQPVGDVQKLLRDVKPNLEKQLEGLFKKKRALGKVFRANRATRNNRFKLRGKMRNFVIKKAISKKGYFDRVLLVSICQNGAIRYFYKKIFKKMMRLANPLQKKFKRKPEINVLEKIGYAFEPINFLSKIKHKFKK